MEVPTITTMMDMIMVWTAHITPLVEVAAAAAAAVQFILVVVEAAAAAVLPSPLGADLLEVLHLSVVVVVVLPLREDLPPLEEDQQVLAPEPEGPLPPEQTWAWKAKWTTLKGSTRSTSQTMAN